VLHTRGEVNHNEQLPEYEELCKRLLPEVRSTVTEPRTGEPVFNLPQLDLVSRHQGYQVGCDVRHPRTIKPSVALKLGLLTITQMDHRAVEDIEGN
jgi:hypothetical protein